MGPAQPGGCYVWPIKQNIIWKYSFNRQTKANKQHFTTKNSIFTCYHLQYISSSHNSVPNKNVHCEILDHSTELDRGPLDFVYPAYPIAAPLGATLRERVINSTLLLRSGVTVSQPVSSLLTMIVTVTKMYNVTAWPVHGRTVCSIRRRNIGCSRSYAVHGRISKSFHHHLHFCILAYDYRILSVLKTQAWITEGSSMSTMTR